MFREVREAENLATITWIRAPTLANDEIEALRFWSEGPNAINLPQL